MAIEVSVPADGDTQTCVCGHGQTAHMRGRCNARRPDACSCRAFRRGKRFAKHRKN